MLAGTRFRFPAALPLLARTLGVSVEELIGEHRRGRQPGAQAGVIVLFVHFGAPRARKVFDDK